MMFNPSTDKIQSLAVTAIPLRGMPSTQPKGDGLTKTDASQYFSVPNHLILTDEPIPYDIFINSSKREGNVRFLKICKKGSILTMEEISRHKEKYIQLYISEFHRSLYLKSIMTFNMEDMEKVDIIKDSAITYLDTLFSGEKEFNTELLAETLNGCRDSVECMVDTLQGYDITALQSLIGNLSFHDFYTYDHSINVSMYCIAILKTMNPKANKEELVQVGLGGLLHDLGKVKVPTSIINKTGKLTEEEFAEIKKHPGIGIQLLDQVREECEGIDFDAIGRVIHEHHENIDGTGYPNKVKGENIHLYAKICSIADFFDAITTKRSYSNVLSMQEAVNVMSNTVGKKICPEIFKVFQATVKKFVQSGNVKFKVDPDFDSERPFDDLPLVPIEELKSPDRPIHKINVFNHKKRDEEREGLRKKGPTKVSFNSDDKKESA